MTSGIRFEQGTGTHVGEVRDVNQDAHLARPRDGVWAVADGMGGYSRGEWASATIVDAIDALAVPDDLEPAAAALAGAIAQADRDIGAEAERLGTPIGSTIAVLLVRETRFAVLWAGDSRVYRCRDGVVERLTSDHSQVEEMVASGLIDRADADDHPMAHVLSRAVGVGGPIELDRLDGEIAAGDVFLLCSDGLSRLVDADELGRTLRVASPRAAASSLVGLALERGAPDNVTVVIVGCEATTLVGGG